MHFLSILRVLHDSTSILLATQSLQLHANQATLFSLVVIPSASRPATRYGKLSWSASQVCVSGKPFWWIGQIVSHSHSHSNQLPSYTLCLLGIQSGQPAVRSVSLVSQSGQPASQFVWQASLMNKPSYRLITPVSQSGQPAISPLDQPVSLVSQLCQHSVISFNNSGEHVWSASQPTVMAVSHPWQARPVRHWLSVLKDGQMGVQQSYQDSLLSKTDKSVRQPSEQACSS
jgi:hypothetical protein